MLTPLGAEILEIAIPLQLTFRHALAERSAAQSVIVKVSGDNGHAGFGECAPREYVTGETAETVRTTLLRMLPAFLGQRYGSFAHVEAALMAAARTLPRDQHAAFCALELALLDLAGRVFGTSAGSVLGPVVAEHVRYSGVVSADGEEGVRKACEQMRAFGIRSAKLKVGSSAREDVAILATARATMGEECSLRVDANCAWTLSEARERIQAFAPFRLDGLEQPLRAEDLAGMAALTAESPIPIIADESLVSVHDAEQLATRRACHLFNVRISKCAGLINSRRIREIGRQHGIGCMLGAQVGETALLTAAGRHFAARVPDVRFCEGSYGKFLLTEDITAQDLTFGRGGEAPALPGPGLGIEVDEERLRRHATRVTHLSR